MLRVAIPFSGDAELFKYGSSPFNSPIPGEIEEGNVILAYTAESPDMASVKADFDHRINQINQMLSTITGAAAEWNRQLPDVARKRLNERRTKVERDQTLSLGYPLAATDRTKPPTHATKVAVKSEGILKPGQNFDLFLSHAREDKEVIARPLYSALTAEGVAVWFDEAVLRMGDSLRQKIDEGLAKCRYGVVILSPRFLSKQWPQRELDGLVARETASGEKAILPIWHELDRDILMRYSPTLADRLAGKSEDGVPALVRMILDAIR
jgi:hypothetical protein